MANQETVISKVLVHESSADAEAQLKLFFQRRGLVGLRDHSRDILELLASSIDLGGVFLAEEPGADGRSGLDLGLQIHRLRPELPIFLRRRSGAAGELPPGQRDAFSATYTLADIGALDAEVEKHLFSMLYPVALIRGIQEISSNAIQSTIRGVALSGQSPTLVKDRLIYGELFSLIPLEGAWCRGFMMLQTTQHEALELIKGGKTALDASEPGFRDVNGLLGEITNLVWGGIKSRFLLHAEGLSEERRTQVPILVNHKEKYISFGTSEPQLCFCYRLTDLAERMPPVEIWQKFVFNLDWRPEAFREESAVVDALVETGELELF